MEKETLEALKGSIWKWEKIVEGTGRDEGVTNCPLCTIFYFNKEHCKDCPVYIKTGLSGCDGTPYEEWDKEVEWITNVGKKAATAKQKAAAQREVDFLKSLLPKEDE